ncbi:hypothetical protein [Marinicrinis lubricantis]|uniref:SPOR domain-containing protein n=1 Tax=Marinicrinis lubricantis TaxID=2086470 RepID=A0ABW1ITU8_9BACL
MNNKSTITYRFNHDNEYEPKRQKQDSSPGKIIPLRQEEFTVREDESQEIIVEQREQTHMPINPNGPSSVLNEFTQDFGTWSSPFETEVERLERMIRESDQHVQNKPPEASQGNQDLPKHSIPDEPDHIPIIDDQIYSRSKVYSRSTVPWFKLVTSIGGAVITGAVFGLFVLQMFTGSDVVNQENANGGEQNAQIIREGDVSGNSSQAEPVNHNSGSVQISYPGQTYYLLQHGIFSGDEGAQQAIQGLKEAGFAAAVQKGDQQAVFAGLTLNRDDALFISHLLQDENKEVYVKTFQLPAVDRVYWSGNSGKEFSDYLLESADLIKVVSTISMVHLEAEEASPLEDTTMDTIQASHQVWSQLASAAAKGAGEEQQKLIQQMNNLMDTAVATLGEYKKNPAKAYLWQAQSAAMEFVLLEQQLLDQIAVK